MLGGHVGYGRPVGNCQVFHSGAEILHEFLNHPLFPEQLCNGENEVRHGNPFVHLAHHFDPNNLRNWDVVRLAEHDSFRLNPANTPAHDPDAVDHCGVRVRSDERVRIGCGLPVNLFSDYNSS